MTELIANTSRPVARVFLIDLSDRILLLEIDNPSGGNRFWVTPGGGLKPGETFENAARRELLEETGLDMEIGPCVWTWRHLFTWNGEQKDQLEKFFLARVDKPEFRPFSPDDFVVSHHWWSIDEIQSSEEEFVPREIAGIISGIIQG